MRLLSAGFVALALLAAAAVPAGATVEYRTTLDVTFPVQGPVTFGDSYHADRDGGRRKHQATDVMASKLQTVHAVRAGTICYITGIDGPPPAYGYYLSLCADDGRTYNYVHLNNDTPGTDDGRGGARWAYAPGIRKGVAVQRGQWLGYVGDSGNAESTAPHLHLEIVDPYLRDPLLVAPYRSDRLNPYPSLRAAHDRGDLPAAVPVEEQRPPVQRPWTAPDEIPDFGDIDGTVHAASIRDLVQRGITRGCGADAYCPAAPVTRAQLASFLVRAKQLPLRTGPSFVDVPAGSVHADAIATVVAAGYARGLPDGRFDPGGALTRAQMASFLSRAMGLPPRSDPAFGDVVPGSTHASAIAALAWAGVTNGCAEGRYCPDNTVTRGELASFLSRALARGL